MEKNNNEYKLNIKELNDYKVRLLQLKDELKYYKLLESVSEAAMTFGIFSTVYSYLAKEDSQAAFTILTIVAVYTKILVSKERQEREEDYNNKKSLIDKKSEKIKVLEKDINYM